MKIKSFNNYSWPNIYYKSLPQNWKIEAAKLANLIRELFDLDTDPISIKFLMQLSTAANFNIKLIKYTYENQIYDGWIYPLENQRFQINIRSTTANKSAANLLDYEKLNIKLEPWQWFRIMHEIAHIFFYDRRFNIPKHSNFDCNEENFCDVFASHMLIPQTIIKNTQLTCSNLLAISKKFSSSLPTTALRFSSLYTKHYILLFTQNTSNKSTEESLVSEWCINKEDYFNHPNQPFTLSLGSVMTKDVTNKLINLKNIALNINKVNELYNISLLKILGKNKYIATAIANEQQV